MEQQLLIYNTLSRQKELFRPLTEGRVGMYVCGPTVYGDGHLGHARPAITFDVVFRYLTHLGYKVRYVRNITDVGHLEHDADEGEDKIAKKARLEQLEPMEVAQYYTNRYHAAMERLNVLPPSIEPHASGHIMEQIALVQQILDAGLAYVSNGSVYFDVRKYQEQTHKYGQLSGRVIEEMLATTRELDGQEEKHFPGDFALWKKASPEHIMRWPSPWSDGFPGWHAECTAMGAKYLGSPFDIHGGGMDLVFPHHESEIAQCVASTGHAPCRYWMHNNMITINGQKMGKSLGNFITLDEFFNGSHKDKDGKEMLEQSYSPMTIRFFILQAHYRSTVDFSNEALQASEKGFAKLMEAYKTLGRLLQHADSHQPPLRRRTPHQPGQRRQGEAHAGRHRRAAPGLRHLPLRGHGHARRGRQRQHSPHRRPDAHHPRHTRHRQGQQRLGHQRQDPRRPQRRRRHRQRRQGRRHVEPVM